MKAEILVLCDFPYDPLHRVEALANDIHKEELWCLNEFAIEVNKRKS